MKQLLSLALLAVCTCSLGQTIPLPEHPRPDFERTRWQNLNGRWQFAFDSLDAGVGAGWQNGTQRFPLQIQVPFPWGSALSGVKDEADIAWYQREISITPEWRNQRTFITVGASDWETTVWLDGHLLGKHQGGYQPFSFELTPHIKYGQKQQLVIRVDDKRRDFTLYGKQGYGNARGIWQTIYLEARGQQFMDAVHFTPDIDKKIVRATVYLDRPAQKEESLTLQITNASPPITQQATIPAGKEKFEFTIEIPNARLWTLEDPFLYDAMVKLSTDEVKTYFGMRKISVVDLPGTSHPYIALNNQPVYLQLTLDQSYHPDGFYTFPTDAFMREEIERAKAIGLNGIRPHIKVEIPRKLYWADRLGMLVMADLPNSWGDPDRAMQRESEQTLRDMIHRDYNHPSIFSWILFNETWGLRTHTIENGKRTGRYLPETQMWVASMYYLVKSLDPTRLVEDNSICCGAGHTVTDINSFHDYLPGWEWDEHLRKLTEQSFDGSTFQFEQGFRQGRQPKINSECGNVWGYEGSTGDVDWSYDYHRMINTFRQYPEIAGWLYTEHHDVINEWNGYWRFDRSNKFTGLEELFPGMTLRDFHAPVYLSTGNEVCRTAPTGATVTVPLFLSSMSSQSLGSTLQVSYRLMLTNTVGDVTEHARGDQKIDYKPYLQQALAPLTLTMPSQPGLAILQFELKDGSGKVLHRNFMHFELVGNELPPKTTIVTVAPRNFTGSSWSSRQWEVMDGAKVCGAGEGYFEYTFAVPEVAGSMAEAFLLFELGAKELFAKDREQRENTDLDYMLGAKASPSANPNAYPMTDEVLFPSDIDILVNGQKVLSTRLPDDPADHRGVLSWHHQLKDRKLREAGSYGYLIRVPLSAAVWKAARQKGSITVRLQTKGKGGLAVYGKNFGRYPIDPSLVVKTK